MTTYRVWRKDEFDTADADERADRAWVPNRPMLPVDEPEEAAQLFAEYCHAKRDGWEWTWPIEAVVHDSDKNLYFVVEVDREMCPDFYVTASCALTVKE